MPKIVVAFRVTIVVAFRVAFRWKPQVGSPDPQKHTPHDSLVLEEIQHGEEISFDHGQQNMWIISHSLGTTMEMFAGRQMAEEGRFLEDHIFNLPFVLAPMDKIREKKVKCSLHIATTLVAVGLNLEFNDKRNTTDPRNAFCALRPWVPYLYVNLKDDFCLGYVVYFCIH